LLDTKSLVREEMDKLLDQLEQLLLDFNSLISDKHFDHRADAHQLVETFWGAQ
jgi:ElaB/YqjD/DUF883 family membrane-anchored ribosome-binding protein